MIAYLYRVKWPLLGTLLLLGGLILALQLISPSSTTKVTSAALPTEPSSIAMQTALQGLNPACEDDVYFMQTALVSRILSPWERWRFRLMDKCRDFRIASVRQMNQQPEQWCVIVGFRYLRLDQQFVDAQVAITASRDESGWQITRGPWFNPPGQVVDCR